MRFTVSALVLAAVAAASAAATPRDIVGKCRCLFQDRLGGTGKNIVQSGATYTCAYSAGSCEWTFAGGLVNNKQTNCVEFAPCLPELLT